ncbi:helix-turn-helix domain-containing protein (plasmid) [Deinococcus psychrotolerans]|uniref:Helix-turn-helix domain-containing protein n=1 Tax=Deinococcus psychrotolerans TaxID=2489213 RepID=A0A3G8YIH1_9DEIO|nr:substrate-binding domain-containing protein [Deinococcus psychrotolerans]AZI44735.1 helix-turn-helix domain-containing protein [Deinococcus psychrotolerans]
MPMSETPANTVKARREGLGLGASELAHRAGMTRQALHRIESRSGAGGGYTPSVTVALQLARALGCRVEDLFSLASDAPQAELVGEAEPGQRLQLARVAGKLLAYPLSGVDALQGSADALMVKAAAAGRVQVEPLSSSHVWDDTAVLYGCDPSLALLCRHAAPARVLLRPAVSERSLEALVRGEAHAAGLHLYDMASGQSNLPFVAAAFPEQVVQVYALWSWEQGLMVRAGNPENITAVRDLGRRGVRVVNRPAGAGSRRLLDDWLREAGLDARTISGYDLEAPTPLDSAEAIAHGRADVGVGPRSAAQAHGLDFVPLLRERFDLVVPEEHLTHPGVQALLQAARSPALRAELTSLGGYDPAESGRLISTLSPKRSA